MKMPDLCRPGRKSFAAGIKGALVALIWLSFWQPAAGLAQTNLPPRSGNLPLVAGGTIATRAGVVYHGVIVQKVVPDGLVVQYAQTDGGIGIAKLKFTDLPDRLQQQFGYNPTNAAAFEKKQLQAEENWRAQWAANDEKARASREEQALADAEAAAKGCGSGFFITDDGYLLTCFHVVRSAGSIQVGTRKGLFNAELVQSDPDRDVALLKVAGTFSALPLICTNSVNLGEGVFTIGFPDPRLQGWQPKLTRGEISCLSGLMDDTHHCQISVPVQPGNSGGPLVDENGNVVGLVQGTLKVSAALAATGMFPQNVNYAIKSPVARAFLDSLPQDWLPKLKPEFPPASRKFGDVVRDTENAVAVVLIQ